VREPHADHGEPQQTSHVRPPCPLGAPRSGTSPCRAPSPSLRVMRPLSTISSFLLRQTLPPVTSSLLDLDRQLLDLGGKDEIVLRQTADRMSPQFDRHVAIAGEVQVGMV